MDLQMYIMWVVEINMDHNNNNKLTKFPNLNIYIYREIYKERERKYYFCYCFIFCVVFVSAYPLSGCFLSSWFTVQSLLFKPKSLLCTLISRATWNSTQGTAGGAREGGSLCGYEAYASLYVVLPGCSV